jgi:copper chaperone
MTCEHCVLSVTEEVSEVAGVDAVDVELVSGRLTVSGNPAKRPSVRRSPRPAMPSRRES